jgi:hypothetical protein
MPEIQNDTLTLGWHEVAMAAEVGRMRYLSAIRRGRVGRHGFAGGQWTEHIEGACGEYVVAKYLGLHWDGSCDAFNRADVGQLEVRTRSRHEYELIVRLDAPDESPFVLVTGRAPTFRVRGWILGRDAKRHEWLKNHGGYSPAFFVPSEKLNPMKDLR